MNNPIDLVEKYILDKSWTHEGSLVIKYHDLLHALQKGNECFEEQIKSSYLKGIVDGVEEREGGYPRYFDEEDYYAENYKK
jgi:hypothetical protein